VIARVRDGGLTCHVVPAMLGGSDLNSGAFLCDRQRPWEELIHLAPHLPAARWKGIVQVRVYPVDALRDYEDPETGPYEVRVGDTALLGDPKMIEVILKALGEFPT
jgi:hypothetical protein